MENLPDFSERGTAREEAGEEVGVSGRTVDKADKIRESAPDVHDRMKRGEYSSVSEAKRVAERPEDDRERIHEQVESGEAESPDDAIRKLDREQRREERIEQTKQLEETSPPPLDSLDQRYALVYADPPWQYEHTPTTESREIENHYPTMDLDAIKDLPVDEIAADKGYLYLWAPPSLVLQAGDVIEAWGFDYRTHMVWDKQKIGMGYYARQQHELLMIARRGDPPTPPAGSRPASVYGEDRGAHSAKPDHFYDMLEKMYPEYSKIELFARNERPGWDSWGNEVESAA